MVEPFEPDKKQEEDNLKLKKEHKTALNIVFQLVRYLPMG